MACRAGGLTVRASSTRHRASVNVRFEPGDRDVGADRAAQGFVTRWWWRVPDGEFGLPQDLLDAGRPVRVVHCVGEERDRRWPSPRMRTAPLIEPTRVLTERARTFRRVWIIGSRPVSVFFRRMQGSTMFAWPPEAPHPIQDLRLGHDPLGVAHQERSSSHSAAVSAITSPPPRSAGVLSSTTRSPTTMVGESLDNARRERRLLGAPWPCTARSATIRVHQDGGAEQCARPSPRTVDPGPAMPAAFRSGHGARTGRPEERRRPGRRSAAGPRSATRSVCSARARAARARAARARAPGTAEEPAGAAVRACRSDGH